MQPCAIILLIPMQECSKRSCGRKHQFGLSIQGHPLVTISLSLKHASFNRCLLRKKRKENPPGTCRVSTTEKSEIDPEELRQLVWEVPTAEIASLYGVSPEAIEKRCRALGIHLPPRGYWLKLNRNPLLPEEGLE